MNSHRQPAARLARLIISGLLLGTALTLGPAAAQDATAPAAAITPQTVVATVGGETITEADIAFAAEDLAQELQQMPPDQRKAFLVTVLIDMKVMAKAARDQQMDQTDAFKQRLRYLEDRALRRAYFGEKIATGVTPEALQAAYATLTASFQGQEEVHARHILVASQDEASAIKAELDGGKDFAELAREKSTDPSAQQNGGDLGFFAKGMMVKPFEDAAFAMNAGDVSAPVQSDFGWHVIKVEEKRTSQPPTLEQVAPQLQQQVMFQNFEAAVAALKQGITIDIPDAALAEGVKQQSEQQAAEAQ
jgi:peptidyl-prolyl cis-trans isomerase C